MSTNRVLLIDDDPATRKYVGACLLHEGYEFVYATDGEDGLAMVERSNPALVILDIMMPRLDGFEVCRRLRAWTQVPIIMLSAMTGEGDKVKCLNLGADDYLAKPFGIEELLARIRAVLRRTAQPTTGAASPRFIKDELDIDFNRRKVFVKDTEVRLTPTEYALLHEMVTNAGKVLTHRHLLQRVWGPQYESEREYLHVFVGRLRTKLEPEPGNPRYFITVPGVGYEFTA